MATFTLREVIDEAAHRLGELATGQTLSADQLTQYENNAAMLIDQLAQDGIVSIADRDSIEASLVPYVATLLANLAGPGVGVPSSLQVKRETEAVIRKLTRGGQTFEQQTPDYY
jgi:hypothetical protein